MSETRDKLLQYLTIGYGFVLEHPFRGLSGKRRFKFDAALPAKMLSVDYHGWGSGAGHMYREKQAGDHEKGNEAQLCGWVYIVCDAPSVRSGKCLDYIEAALERDRAVLAKDRVSADQ